MSSTKRNDSLYNLIKSLNQSEKRYLKRYASIQVSEKKPAFLVLFEIIDKMAENNEEKIKVLLKKKSGKSNYNETKYYLYNLILRALHNYNYDSDLSYHLQNQAIFAKILYDKNLFKDSRKLSKKIIELAGRHNDYLVVYQAAFNSLMIRFHDYEVKDSIEKSLKDYETIMGALNTLKEEAGFQLEYYKNFVEYKYTHLVLESEHKSAFEKLIGTNFIPDTDISRASKLSQSRNYNANTLKHLIKGNNEGAMKEMQLYLTFFGVNPDFKKRHIKNYFALMGNYAFTLRVNGKLKESAELFYKMRKEIFDDYKSRAENFAFLITQSCLEEIKIHLSLHGLSAARIRAKDVEDNYLEILALNKTKELEFIFLNSYCYFLEKDLKKCIAWLRKIFLEKHDYIYKQTILKDSFLLFSISHWENKNYETIDSVFKKNEKTIELNLDENNFKNLKSVTNALVKNKRKSEIKAWFQKNKPVFTFEKDDDKGIAFDLDKWVNTL